MEIAKLQFVTPPATVVPLTMTCGEIGDGPCTDTERIELGLLTWAFMVSVMTPRVCEVTPDALKILSAAAVAVAEGAVEVELGDVGEAAEEQTGGEGQTVGAGAAAPGHGFVSCPIRRHVVGGVARGFPGM